MPMYAVVRTGGKQARVEEGQRLEVERLGASVGDDVSFTRLLVDDGASQRAPPNPAPGGAGESWTSSRDRTRHVSPTERGWRIGAIRSRSKPGVTDTRADEARAKSRFVPAG